MADLSPGAGDRAEEVTALLHDWNEGDPQAEERVFAIVYEELRRIAAGFLRRERDGHTLQPTALVNEAYLRLVGARQEVSWQDRAHFYGIAARVMRQILIRHARSRATVKRGGHEQRVLLDADVIAPEETAEGLVALDEALDGLARVYPRQARVVELKFFGGLEAREIASSLQISEKTVGRDWGFARTWLHRELGLPAGQS